MNAIEENTTLYNMQSGQLCTPASTSVSARRPRTACSTCRCQCFVYTRAVCSVHRCALLAFQLMAVLEVLQAAAVRQRTTGWECLFLRKTHVTLQPPGHTPLLKEARTRINSSDMGQRPRQSTPVCPEQHLDRCLVKTVHNLHESLISWSGHV